MMKDVTKINPFQSSIKKTELDTITTLTAEIGISAKESITFGQKLLTANNVYGINETYNLVYTIVDTNGTSESFVEEDGILPTLFLSPNNENYVSIIPYHPDKELEISIPLFNRENTELPKGNRPFVGDFIGVSNQFSILYDVDIWSDTKPDKLLAIEFKDGAIKKKHNIKVPLPRNNKIFIENNEIHLLAKDGNMWLHRQIDEKGNVLRERKLKLTLKNFRQVLSLSFEDHSYLLSQEKNKIVIEKIEENGSSSIVELLDFTDPFYNTWRPVKISEDCFVTRFNGEFGNGWMVTKNGQLVELFYGKDEKGYRELLSNKIIEMESDNLIISSISKTKDNAYAVVFYPSTDRQTKNKKLIILNHEI